MSNTRTIYSAIEEAILEYTDGTGRIYSEMEEGLWHIADQAATALAPDPQIIVKTPAELEVLDPYTVVLDGIGETYPVRAYLDADEYEKSISERYLPAVKVAEGAHLRACREALEGETP